ncbi:MAG: class I SAM-dependent methyltransferase [Deltaproteobacteria bacterium]
MAKKKKRKKSRPTKAERADRYAMYLDAVQAPDVDAKFFNKIYRSNFKRGAKVLREDFCGTAAVCCEWVKRKKDRVAYGVDLDPEPLAWGTEHNLARLSEAARERVHLIEGNVLDADVPKADIVAAQNFSYCVFEQRALLRQYFERIHASLADEGVFILDLFGGFESLEEDREETTSYDGFDYIWHQVSYDPITAHGQYKIHFAFSDKSEIRDAFVYDWRLWTLPEVQEVLVEAGFDRADVYWEGTDKRTGDGNGIFKRAAHGDSDPAWNAYIVGVKGAAADSK